MKRKKIKAIVMCCIISILFMVGCGNTDTSSTSDNDTSTTDISSGSTTDQEDDSVSSDINDSPTENTDENTNSDIVTPPTPGKLTSEDGGLELEDKSQDSDGNIIGNIKNLTNHAYSYVEVDINLYDSNNNQVDSTLTNTTNLAESSTWSFTAPIINHNNVASYRVVKISAMR